MKKKIHLLLCMWGLLGTVSGQNVKYVAPFIGTQGTGHTFPGPSLPFGMVQPGPDCNNTSWDYTSGYQYADSTLLGFSQTHLSGTGIGELGDVLLLPFADNEKKGILKKHTEKASAGYYSVEKADGVKAELTCTHRVAFHQYTFPSANASLLLDFQHGIRFLTDSLVLHSDIQIKDKHTITGYCHTKNWVERKYFFVIKFDTPFSSMEQLPLQAKENAPRYVAQFKLKSKHPQLKVKVALSTTGVEGAEKNLQQELPHWDFEAVRKQASDQWSRYLDKIQIEADEKRKRIFYTCMYHLLLQPSNIADVDGRYRGVDDQVSCAEHKAYFSTLSNWDIYRAAFPLLQFIAPEVIDPIVRSMIVHHQKAGFLPIWTAWGKDNYCMIGNHAIPMIVSAYQNGFSGFNPEEAFAAIQETSTTPHIHSDWDTYRKYGYYPFDIVKDESVSKALENGYDDWCVAFMAEKLQKKEVSEEFYQRARFYKNLFDSDSRLFRGKDSKGKWRTDFNPFKATSPMNNPGDYTEANAWQYFWTPAQQDVEGITKLLGGKAQFTRHLDYFFATETENPDKYLGQEGMIGLYAHGNEPCHHVAYLYKFSDKPWKTDFYVNQIVNRFYGDQPDGIIGNDDCGQMSAWYIFSTLGFYPVNPANGVFVLGAPQVKRASVSLGNGRKLIIEADGFTASHIYAGEITYNGIRKDNSINFKELMEGGTLQYKMVENPVAACFKPFHFGSIKPLGWLKEQMQMDMKGILTHLPELIPELINDPIYGSGRLSAGSKAKDLGNHKEGDAEGEEQYKWWNSETQSNWRDAYIRNAIMLNDTEAMKRVDEYVREILTTQDEDGYLGIYTPSLRYRFDKENGELWSKTTLLRGLLAYYEATGKQDVWKAICRAVDNVMEKWPIYGSAPFDAGTEYNGGVAHGLTFTDVLDRMYQLTGDRKYLDYALFLYLDYSSHFSSESDAQLENILDKEYKLKCHGVHTYEHLRPLIVAAQTTTDEKVINALNLYLDRIAAATTATGGAIGDEWIGERCAHPYDTGYEFCSLHELLDSYSVLLQKKGEATAAERMETIFYNAALGMRLKDGSGIAYLKTDNSYEMRGTRNGHPEADRKQTRYKYSPVHQDVAVCCVPNSLRITPYFIQKAWMTDSEGHLVCNLLLPCALETEYRGGKVKIEMQTSYPLSDSIRLSVHCETDQRIKLRKPAWAKEIKASKEYATEGNYLVFSCKGGCTEPIDLKLVTAPRVIQDRNGFHYFAYGAVIYALHHEAAEEKGRVYAEHFHDRYFYPEKKLKQYKYLPNQRIERIDGKLVTRLFNTDTQTTETVELKPMMYSVLRQVAF